MSLDPRARARVQSVSVRPSVRLDVTNAELAEACLRGLEGKLAEGTRQSYGYSIRDALRYFQTPEGAEIPVRKWTKAEVWGYLHFAESSYCANFQQLTLRQPVRAACQAGRWAGYKLAEEMARENCAECPLFRRSGQGMQKRLQALNRFFSYLARVGVVPVNFVRDIVEEWYDEEGPEEEAGERKRNPTVAEMVRLVNGTTHPARRAFYAASAKWACRPNEMLRLDRYASFGLPTPAGLAAPGGFRRGFPEHPHVPSFEQGGQLVYLPERVNAQGEKVPEKRRGNRWLVVDGELRPILEQYLAWWDRHVTRDPETGLPVTTALWLNEAGRGEQTDPQGRLPPRFSARWFYVEAERLGLMRPGERKDPLRRWTGHCQRHFFEQVCEMNEVPGDWCNHFRGDAFSDSRGSYFHPKPEQVLEKYARWIPTFGFNPLPDVPRRAGRSEAETHRNILQAELQRVRAAKRAWMGCAAVTIHASEGARVVPQRIAGSLAYARRAAEPGAVVRVDATKEKRVLRVEEVERVCAEALALLRAAGA